MALISVLERSTGGVSTRGGNVSAYNLVGNDQINVFLSPMQATAIYQLPAPVADFVGREGEIAVVLKAVQAGKPIGIFGLGGFGKTELARVVASRLAGNFPDAQLLISLQGGLKEPRRAEDALLNCLVALRALPPERNILNIRELQQLYLGALKGKRALVLLDDAANLKQVGPLLPPAGCALIITARSPIAVPGLERVLLDSLPQQEALQLFESIAKDIDRDIANQICSLCGFLPLAVRACATRLAYTPDLDPREYATRLEEENNRLTLIANPDIGGNIEAVLDSSYQLLNHVESTIFKRLAVFQGSWDSAAEEHICEDHSHQALTHLVKLSLVTFDKNQARYRFHDLVRLYASKKLDSSELDGQGQRTA